MGRWAQRHRRGGSGPLPGMGPPAGTVLATNRGTFQGDCQVGYPDVYQAFRIAADQSGEAHEVDLVMLVNNPSTWTVRAVAFDDGSGVPGALISSGTPISSGVLPTSYVRTTFAGLVVPVTAGTHYWLGLLTNATVVGQETWIRGVSIAGGFSAGMYRSSNGTSWSLRLGSATGDFDLKV